MAGFGITAIGAYVPRLRLAREAISEAHRWMAPALNAHSKGERAFCSWDEDAITLAVEAARDCLGDSGGAAVKSLVLASTTFPFDDLQNSSIVAAALRLPPETGTLDLGHSQRAGLAGLRQMLCAEEPCLFVAADRPNAKPASLQELNYGAGAVAFRLGTDGVIAKLVGSATVTEPFVDHFRAAGARYDYFWEERWIRDEGHLKLAVRAIRRALEESGAAIDDLSTFVMGTASRAAAEAVARKIGFTGKVADGLLAGCGYSGAAHTPLMLAAALEAAEPGERILSLAFGQGAEALILEATDAIDGWRPRRGVGGSLDEGLSTDSYGRMLSFYGGIELDWGMRAEKSGKTALTEQYRSSQQITGFVAGKCGACGTVQFPQLQYCVKPDCHAPAEQFSPMPLEGEPFRVMTYTSDWLSYHPAPPLVVGFVQFEIGARLLMEIVDLGPEGIDVGTPLRAVFRIKERDQERGYNRYFWKATPELAGKEQVRG